jgi:tetratricopeptide (TPR) repeat protein
MTARDDHADAASETAARQFAAQFDADSAAALKQFRRMLGQKARADRLLQRLNRLGRPDIVIAATDDLAVDAQTPVLFVIERARAFCHDDRPRLAERLLEDAGPARGRDYAFHYHAGRILAEAGMPEKALASFQAAFRIKPTAEASEFVFITLLRLGRFAEASAAMSRILRAGSYNDGLSESFALLLRRTPAGALDPDVAFALAELPGQGASSLAPSLLPHLVASDQLDCVHAVIARAAGEYCDWDDTSLSSVVPYLRRNGRIDDLLALYRQVDSTSEAGRRHFDAFMNELSPEIIAKALIPDLSGFLDAPASPDAERYSALCASFSRGGDAELALSMMRLLPVLVAPDRAPDFYGRERHALGWLSTFIVRKLGPRPDVTEALAEFAAFVVPEQVRAAFETGPFDHVRDAISLAGRMNAAMPQDRQAFFREEYFEFYLERRWFIEAKALRDDRQFCAAAENYFQDLAGKRGAIATPVGRFLQSRLQRATRSDGGGAIHDPLTSFALTQESQDSVLARSTSRDDFCWWYATRVAGARKVPPDLLDPDVVADLNTTVGGDDGLGLPVTRFLKLFWRHALRDRASVDLNSVLDRVLFLLRLLAWELPASEPYLPLLTPLLRPDGFAARIIERLGGGALEFRNALAGAPRTATRRRDDALRHVLLVGHASKGTGLGRNFGMLAEGLAGDATVVTGLDFDSDPDAFTSQLARWRESSGPRPIAVFAVNAQDVADAFAMDRKGILFDCYCAGFFLWEVSQAPPVQRLGIRLVDEVWAPTRYVADIYSPLVPTHVVGKGLYRGDEEFLFRPKPPRQAGPFTFVTAFDFDSSIERKNPLATVLAFQDAFRVDEPVALVVKTTNVNPRHWSNSTMHWERMIAAAAGDSRIRIVNERYTGEQMSALLRDADCVVSLHRSEGFGYLVSDAMAFGTPVIATGYSGNADFTSEETAYPVPFQLVPVPPGAARWRCDNALWADADIAAAAEAMRAVFGNYEEARRRADRARELIRRNYAVDAFRSSLASRIDAILRTGPAAG